MQIYFSDFFGVSPDVLEEYGAFNISLINDLPLFVDPFLLFNSVDSTYQQLHDNIIQYLRFLRDQSRDSNLDRGLIASWYQFKEIKQNWLGFSQSGNAGSGPGPQFARSLHRNLGTIFKNFGHEQITHGSHLEKVCLIDPGIGRDNISDFTTSLIKGYLLEYTQQFALEQLLPEQRGIFSVEKVRFSYATQTWETHQYELPAAAGDYILLTPKDMLTGDSTWISRPDLLRNFERIAEAVPDYQLRAQLSNYLNSRLSADPGMTQEERDKENRQAISDTIAAYPEIVEYYIREREESGDRAKSVSSEIVAETQKWFVDQVRVFVAQTLAQTQFYVMPSNTYDETKDRIEYLKHVIEQQGGHEIFYYDGKPVQREADLQRLFKFVWFGSPSAVDAEVNNGRGPVDFSISRGSQDKTQVEFKLASNSKLRQNLAKQLEIYMVAGRATGGFKVICFFSQKELDKVVRVLHELGMESDPGIVLIDARDNKPSASRA